MSHEIQPCKLSIDSVYNWKEKFFGERWITINCPTEVQYAVQNHVKKSGYVRCTYNSKDIGNVPVSTTASMQEAAQAGLDFCQAHWNNLFEKIMRGEK